MSNDGIRKKSDFRGDRLNSNRLIIQDQPVSITGDKTTTMGRSARVEKMKLVPIDDNVVIAATLLSVVDKGVRKKTLLTVEECLLHAGASLEAASNRSIQQRVRRRQVKLEFRSVLAVTDALLNRMNPCPLSQKDLQMLVLDERMGLIASALVYGIAKSAQHKASRLGSARKCMRHASSHPWIADNPSKQKQVQRLLYHERSIYRIFVIIFKSC